MTPADLYTVLGLGLGVLVSVAAVGWSAYALPRAWVAATQGRPGWALTILGLNGLVLYGINQGVPMPTEPRWQSVPIVCDAMCGWNYFYVITIGVFTMVSFATAVMAPIAAILVVSGVLTWRSNPAGPDAGWERVTNGQWLSRQIGLLIAQHSLRRFLALHLGTRPPFRVPDWAPEHVRTSFLVEVASPGEIEPNVVRDLALSHDMVIDAQYELWDPETDQFEVVANPLDVIDDGGQQVWLRVTWDLGSLERAWTRPFRTRRRRPGVQPAAAPAAT